MAIAKQETAQIQQQNGIAQTADINAGRELASSTSRISQLVKNFGDNLVSASGEKIAEQRAVEDIQKQQRLLAKGEAGDFNEVGGIVSFLNPTYAKTYNDIIDRVAVPNYTAQFASKISDDAQQIRMDPSIDITKKVQALSQKVKETLPDSLDAVPPEFRAKVAQMSYAQSTREVAAMMNFSIETQTKIQRFASYNNIENLAILGRKSGTLEDANNYMNQIQEMIQGGVTAGITSPEEARTLQNNYKADILGHFAVNAGITNIKQWNEQNGSPLDEATVDGMQAFSAQQYIKEQSRQEQEQLQNGYSFELQIAKVMNGYSPTAPAGGYTDREWAHMQKALFTANEQRSQSAGAQAQNAEMFRTTGLLYNAFKDMNAEDRLNLQVGNFDKLPEKYTPYLELFEKQPAPGRKFILSRVKDHTTNVQDLPIVALELPRPDILGTAAAIGQGKPIPQSNFNIEQRQSALVQQLGSDKANSNITDSVELQQLIQVAQSGPDGPRIADQTATKIFGMWSPIVRAKLRQSLPEAAAGYTLLNTPGMNNNLKQSYLSADLKTNISDQRWVKKVGSTWFNGLKSLHPDSIGQTVAAVNKIVNGSRGTITPEDALDSLFDKGDILRAKGDSEYINSRSFKREAGKIGIDNVDALRYYPETDVYSGIGKDGANYTITGVQVRNPNYLSSFSDKLGVLGRSVLNSNVSYKAGKALKDTGLFDIESEDGR